MSTSPAQFEPICTLPTRPVNYGDLLEGIARLTTSGVTGVTEIVQAMHREIVLRPMGLNQHPLGEKLWKNGITNRVYSAVKYTIQHSGGGVAASLRLINQLTPTQKKRPLPPSLYRLVAILNGVAGDHLVQMGNPLTLPTMFYDRYGQPHKGPVGQRVVILTHGLCMDHFSWHLGTSKGLGEQISYHLPTTTILYLNYNTGRRISLNGRSFAALLEELVHTNPDLQEIDLIGHSMGGLVSRSALFYGKQSGHEWVKKVQHLVCLGSPHEGAVLEQLGLLIQLKVGKLPFAGNLAQLANVRSAGILDLRHGSVRDDDWEHLDNRIGVADDVRKPAPLPSHVKTYLVAGTIERKERNNRALEVIGDYLVTVQSALGEHPNPAYRLRVPDHRKAIFHGVNHLELQFDANVRNQVIAWLMPGAYLPQHSELRVEYETA